jgi:HSP20 family protein
MFRTRFPFYRNVDPFREVSRLQNEMNRLFEGTLGGTPQAYPPMNVWTNDEGAVLTAELPGVDPETIDISVTGNAVTVNGIREAAELPDGVKFNRQERFAGKFSRSFELPFNVESDKVDAVFQKGILQLSLPRAEAEKPRRITVKAA